MSEKTKRNLKKVGIILVGGIEVILVGLSIIGLGEIFHEQCQDPEWWKGVYMNTSYGWIRKFQ